MKRIILFPVVLFILINHVLSQSDSELSGKELLEEAEIASDSADYEKAVKYFALAQEVFQEQTDPIGEINTLIGWAQTSVTFGKEEDFARFINDVANLYQAHDLNEDTLWAEILFTQGVSFYILDFNIDSSLAYIQRALDVMEKELGLDHVKLAPIFNALGTLYSNSDQELSISYLEKARRLLVNSKSSNLKELATNYHDRATIYYYQGESKKALDEMKEAIKMRLQVQSPNHPDLAGNYNGMAVIHSALGNFIQERYYLDKALAIIEKKLPKGHPIRGVLLSNLVGYHYDMETYEQGLEVSRKVLDMNTKQLGEDHISIALDLNGVAVMHMNLGEYQKSVLLLNQAVNIQEANVEEAGYFRGNTYHNLGLCYKELGEMDKALLYAQKALEVFSTYSPKNKEKWILLYSLLNNIHGDMGAYDKQLDVLNKGFDILKNRLPEEEYLEVDLYLGLANYYEHIKDYPNALKSKKKAIELRIKDLPRGPLGLAEAYAKLSRLFLIQDELKEAKNAIKWAFYYANIEKEDSIILSSTSFKVQRLRFPYLHQMIGLYLTKADVQMHEYLFSKKVSILDSALNDYHRAIQILTQIKFRYRTDKDRLNLSKLTHKVVESALRAIRERYLIAEDPQYMAQAFEMIESTKGINALQVLIDHQAYSLAGIPSSILEKEKQLKQDMGTFRRKIWEEESSGQKDTAKISLWQNEWYARDQAYTRLLDSLENHYEHYYSLKYKISLPSLSKIQEDLQSKNSTLLEYFAGDSSLHILLISPDTIIWHVTNNSDWKQAVNKMTKWLRTNPSRSDSTPTVPQFYELGTDLYNELIEPVSPYLKQEHLIIVPDGSLFYLPFEILIDPNKKSKTQYFKDLPYLVNDFFIQYQYSASLWERNLVSNSGQSPYGLFLAFAPFAGNENLNLGTFNHNSLQNLPSSREEVEALLELYKEKVYWGIEATKNAWLKEAPNYRILHLATHGKTEDLFPLSSCLYFSGNEDSALFISDLLGVSLHADLVVLSACETGVGTIQTGEGMQSLSRAFFFAGAHSLLASSWKIEDRSTADLMTRFYEYLTKGYAKDKALALAKRGLLSESPANKEFPYFWAGFNISGSSDPLPQKKKQRYWLWGLLAILMIGAGMYGWRSRG